MVKQKFRFVSCQTTVTRQHLRSSEFHGVHFVILGEAEASAHVVSKAWGLVSLDVLDEGVINLLLEGSALRGDSFLFVFFEYVSTFGLGGLVLESSIGNL